MSRGGKRSVAFIQGDEPKFLQEFKQRAGYLSGPALEEKFMTGKVPKKEGGDGEDSASNSGSDDEVDRKKARRRGFSPTSRFGKDAPPGRSDSPDNTDRPDEKPLVVTSDGKDVVADESSKDDDDDDAVAGVLDHAGQLKSGGNEMNRSLDMVYGRSAAKSVTAKKTTETADVEKLVATGGKFVFKKPTNQSSEPEKIEDDEDRDEAPSGNTKKWRQDGVFGEQGRPGGSSAPAKKKSESRAVADRKLLSFEVEDD